MQAHPSTPTSITPTKRESPHCVGSAPMPAMDHTWHWSTRNCAFPSSALWFADPSNRILCDIFKWLDFWIVEPHGTDFTLIPWTTLSIKHQWNKIPSRSPLTTTENLSSVPLDSGCGLGCWDTGCGQTGAGVLTTGGGKNGFSVWPSAWTFDTTFTNLTTASQWL